MREKSLSIQALRGIGFLFVFLYHGSILPSGGVVDVSIFFELSGFLLVQKNADKDISCVPIINNFKYSFDKIKRLYPLHIIMSIIAIPLLLYRCIYTGNLLINVMLRVSLNILLIQTWIPIRSIAYSMNDASCFLCCLAFCYFIFPAVFNGINRIKGAINIIVGIITTIILMIIMIIWTNISIHLYKNGIINVETLKIMTYNFPLFRAGDFIIGCLGGSLFHLKSRTQRNIYITSIAEIIMFLILIVCTVLNWNSLIGGCNNYFEYMTIALLIPSLIFVWQFARCEGVISILSRQQSS